MTRSRSIHSSKVNRISAPRLQLLGVLAALLFVCVTAKAQTAPTDGMTPSGLAPGAAAGSYGLSGFDNVNLYKPLLGIGGRGAAQTQMRVSPNSVRWMVEQEATDFGTIYSPNPNWWEGISPGYGPGVLQARNAVVHNVMHPQSMSSLTRLTFTAPDGTEYQLIDTFRGGQAYPVGGCSPGTRNRGQIFVSHDSSAFLTFVSNANIFDQCLPSYSSSSTYSTGISGYLFFPDGARYEITEGLV